MDTEKEKQALARSEQMVESLKKYLKTPLYLLALVVISFWLVLSTNAVYEKFFKQNETAVADSSVGQDADTATCNVAGINMHGDLWTYIPQNNENDTFANQDVVSSEDVISLIDWAEADSGIKAILIEADSSGGLPVAGEEIAQALKNSTKPTVALVRQSGTSAAYWAISSADRIFASKNSDVGSIGVTMSYLDNVVKNQKEGLQYVQLSIGKYKDTGSPDKLLTKEEKDLIMRDLAIVHENFINDVSTNRKIPIEEVRKMADGSSMLGEMAKSVGLIDEIGGIYEVDKYLETKIGVKPEICWQ